jgi:hypothetical protein
MLLPNLLKPRRVKLLPKWMKSRMLTELAMRIIP